MGINEFSIEKNALGWFQNLRCEVAFGPDISPEGEETFEPVVYDQVVLIARPHTPLGEINSSIVADALDEAIQKHDPSTINTFDFLISKLISGELHITDAKKFIEEVGCQ